MRVYRITESLYRHVAVYAAVIAGFLAVGTIVVYFSATSGEGLPWVACVPAYAIVGWSVYANFLRVAYEIVMRDDDLIAFRSLIGTTMIRPAEIRSIEPSSMTFGCLVVRHDRGHIHLVHQMDGFSEFVSTLKSINPDI